MIEYVKGDATRPSGTGPKIIAHIVNNAGAWGAGFVIAVSRRWSQPEDVYLAWEERELGTVQLVEVAPDLFVANLCAQDNLGRVSPPVRYDALRRCLNDLAVDALTMGASVHMPRIGCGIGGGRWPVVESIIAAELEGIDVTVYDLP